MSATEDPEQEIIIAVMGVTGTGKSYFIKEVSGILDVEVSSSLHSCTAEVQSYSFPYEGVKITLVDTPGFNDSTKSDTEVLRDICAWMSVHYKKGKLLSGIIYLHRITDNRMDGSSIKYVKMFQKMCGSDAMKNVLLATTHWSNIAKEQGESREGELRKGEFWGGLITEGATVTRFTGIRESGLELIGKLTGKKPKPLDVQDQLVEKKMEIAQTNAGKFLNAELTSAQKGYQRELEDLKRKIQEAEKQKDEIEKEILEIDLKKSQKMLDSAIAEEKLLANLMVEVMKKVEETIREKEEERQRNDRAVIAVAAKNISPTAHLKSLVLPYPTIGHLVYDIGKPKELEEAPLNTLNIEIKYQSNVLAPAKAIVKVFKEFFDKGMSRKNYIIYSRGYYQCKPEIPIEVGSQKFVIFSKY